MIFIGDIHGQLRYYRDLIANVQHTPTIQVGDFGIGFPNGPTVERFEGDHWFIRGNHDNPSVARAHPNYLGEFGFKKEWNLFFVSGADSIDKQYRTEGVSWWRDEELDLATFMTDVIPLYEATRPRIVVTHTCPTKVLLSVLRGDNGWGPPKPKRTEQALQSMFELHQPDLWVFGHLHRSYDARHNGTRFIGLREFEIIEIEDRDEHDTESLR